MAKSNEKNPNVEGRVSVDAAHVYNELDWERRDKAKWIEKYHTANTEKEVLKSQKNSSTVWDIVFNFIIFAAGGLLFTNFGWNPQTIAGVILIVIAWVGSIQNIRK